MAASTGRLNGLVAIVTAGGQGIGEATAVAYAKEGASLVITGRTLSKLEAVAAKIKVAGGKVRCLEAYAGNRAHAKQTVKEAVSNYGRLDVLVNCAQSYTDAMPMETVLEENLRINFESGVIGSLQLMQLAFPHFRQAGAGSVINFGSSYGLRCEPGFLAYAANKEAIRALTRTAAREWGKYKIRVNTVLPSALTPKSREYLEQTKSYDYEAAKTSLGYIGSPEDVAHTMVFLASGDSYYVSGQTIGVDAGSTMF